ncbi:NAD-dependent succinate-semialdehyde dehydrogenase [Sinorhizobium psoraleae]|uniref:NAD-dependent succinate-semialdehyde dehydrogenase n=1 Tax=Sinorhizobium psoraleae TaxID=520838 RepID=UPI00156A1D46|nr:NAD-dependent succinate-semialdehyde dehydrogenase [Sinorhizobium psoraleae]
MQRLADALLLIDGEWRASAREEWLDILNPATEQTIGRVAKAGIEDLDAALKAAQYGFLTWRDVPARERAHILRNAAGLIRQRVEDLALVLTLEQGKPLAQAKAEILSCADIYEWSAEEATRAYGRLIPARQTGVVNMVVLEPVGPVAAFTPWNFPASQAARKIASALAAGCSMILKPPEDAPSAAIGIVKALTDAGLPSGVMNVVFGVPAEISSHLIASPVIRKVSFTGSVPVGKHLAGLAAEVMKPTTMELGGHSPVLVFDDVDPAASAKALAANKFRNAGQICISPTRFMLQDDIYEPFLDTFVDAARAVRLGDGNAETTDMGPLANARRLEAVSALIDDAVGRGAKVATGGRRHGNVGYFYEPTVLTDIPPEARILHEEPFGPVVLVSRFSDTDAAIEAANATPYGLAAYAYTRNAATVEKLTRRLEAGVVSINSGTLGLIETPFGGMKESGYGREGGSETLAPYLVTKFVAHATV